MHFRLVIFKNCFLTIYQLISHNTQVIRYLKPKTSGLRKVSSPISHLSQINSHHPPARFINDSG